MNTLIRLTTLAAVFAFLTTSTSPLHAQLLAPNNGIDVPNGTRKCIKPQNRAPKLTNLAVPLTCLAPVVNVSAATGNQAESFVNVNPTNPNNLVAFSNTNANSIFRAYSTNGGATWTRGTVATGVACCDAQAAFDSFGNLFVVYINASVNQINVILSTDGGVTFGAPVTVGTGSVDQPSIAVGNGSVWVDWNSSGSMVARGAPVTGLGVWGPFNPLQTIPSAAGSFGGIAVGPGPNGGKVIVTYQNPTGGQGPATIYTNVDADGLGAGGFGARVTVTSTNVGGFDFIPAQNGRSIDAEAGVVWDGTGGPFNNRIYLVYTEETFNENNDTDILMRTSTDDGATWSAPVRVNDDATVRSQFLPYVALDPTTGTVAVGFHDCRNDNGVPGSGGTNMIPNDDAEYYGTYSTDGGATWAPNVRLSGGFSNAAASGNGVDFGDYVGLSAFAGKLYPGWGDNANCDGTNPNGTLQAFDLYANSNSLVLPAPLLCTEFFENFDRVTAPALPTGWTAANAAGPAPLWVTATTTPASPPNYAFVDDPAVVSDKRLDTPGIYISASSVRLLFSHSFNLEASGGQFYDGGVLEVSSPNINGGAFTDITNAAVGGSFVSGGYSGTISTSFSSPLAGRMAWSGNSGGYVSVVANPGPNVVGRTVKFRFRMASDSSQSAGGWSIDGFAVQDFACPLQTARSRKVHGGAGTFDINLPFDATTLLSSLGIECRSGGATNDYQLVLTFGTPVNFTGALLSAGTGSVSSTSGSGTTTVTVNLTGITSPQRASVTVLGVNTGTRLGDMVVPMGVLVGDSSGDGIVNGGDAIQTRSRSGQPTDATNFRSDVNTDGNVNGGDTIIVRSRSGTSLP
ncbi:MAG: hypothetical protein ACR2ID_00300 [Chthoniobacterales bacterium]